MAEEDHRTKIVSEIDAEVGRLDILINNAGINELNTLTDISLEQWNKLVNVNLSDAFLNIQACAPLMKRSGGGSIVNLGSTAGIMGHPIVAYSSSNEALVG